jgi:hypothetical protein
MLPKLPVTRPDEPFGVRHHIFLMPFVDLAMEVATTRQAYQSGHLIKSAERSKLIIRDRLLRDAHSSRYSQVGVLTPVGNTRDQGVGNRILAPGGEQHGSHLLKRGNHFDRLIVLGFHLT